MHQENEDVIEVDPVRQGKYIVTFDPLDGSSNIDCLVSIGSIFAIFKKPHDGPLTSDDALQVKLHQLFFVLKIFFTVRATDRSGGVRALQQRHHDGPQHRTREILNYYRILAKQAQKLKCRV